MKRYPGLICPKCHAEDTIRFLALAPDEPECSDCDEVIDLDFIEKFIESWKDYLTDLNLMLEKEGKADAATDNT